MAKKTDARVQYTKAMFHKALLELMALKPVAKISVRELCDGAGLNRGTFYLHYETVEDVLHEVEQEFIQKNFPTLLSYLKSISDRPGMESKLSMSGLFQGILSDLDTFRLLCSHGVGDGFTETLKRAVKPNVIAEWKREFPDYSDRDLALVFDFVFAGSTRILLSWADQPEQISAAELARDLDRLGHHALLAAEEFAK